MELEEACVGGIFEELGRGRVGVFPDRDNVGEVLGVTPELEENAELVCEVEEDVDADREIFGNSGVCG